MLLPSLRQLRRARLISLLLLPAFLVTLLFPVHFHLHHGESGHAHTAADHPHTAHVLHLHAAGEVQEADPHLPGHVINPATDLIGKLFGVKLPLFILACGLIWLLSAPRPANPCRPTRFATACPSLPNHTRPLLRAPPRVC